MATEQTYILDGPIDFFFPFPVRTAGQIVVSIEPGGVLPSSAYEVIGASATATGITVRYPDAPRDGLTNLRITRRTEPDRVSQFLDDLSITARALNAEFDNILQIVQDGGLVEFRGDWVTERTYFSFDVVRAPDTNLYVATEPHVSDDFNADLAAGKWLLSVDFETGQAAVDASAQAAEAARDKAEQWAEEDEDVEVEPGEFSAKHHAIKAAASEAIATQAASDAAPVSAIVSEITTVAGIESEVIVVSDIESEVVTVSGFPDEIQAVGLDLTGGTFDPSKLYDLGSITNPAQGLSAAPDGFIVTVFNNLGDVTTVAANVADIGSVASISTSVIAVAAIDTDVTAVAAIDGSVVVAANNTANIVAVAAIDTDVTTVAAIDTDVTTVAAIDTDVTTVASIDAAVTTVATIDTDVTTVAAIDTDVTTAAANIQAIIDAPQAASDAEAARDKAQLWAQEDEDVEVEPGEFSAFHWAQKAQGFAQGAAINISYDNTVSGLTADDVQAAIDELVQAKANLDNGNSFTGNQTIDGNVTITGTLDCGSIA